MDHKITFLFVVLLSHCTGEKILEPIKKLQKFYGDGTSDDYSNVFYKILTNAAGLTAQAAEQLKIHLQGGAYGFHDEHVNTFVANMKLISEKKIVTNKDLAILKKELYKPDHFMSELVIEQLLTNRDNSEDASKAFDEAFISVTNDVVQLYFTEDEDIFQGVIVAAKQKTVDQAVYLVFVID